MGCQNNPKSIGYINMALICLFQIKYGPIN